MASIANSMFLLLVAFCVAFPTRSSAQSQMQEHENEFRQLVNSVRTDPTSFIPFVDEYYYQWRSFVADVKGLEKAVKEIKQRLKKQKALPALQLDSSLYFAAFDHAFDSFNMNIIGHIGSDNSDPQIRVARHGKWSAIAECITYGQKKTSMMLAAMLVDEGTPNRAHRESILSKKYTHIGVSVTSHPRYTYQCVALLGN